MAPRARAASKSRWSKWRLVAAVCIVFFGHRDDDDDGNDDGDDDGDRRWRQRRPQRRLRHVALARTLVPQMASDSPSLALFSPRRNLTSAGTPLGCAPLLSLHFLSAAASISISRWRARRQFPSVAAAVKSANRREAAIELCEGDQTLQLEQAGRQLCVLQQTSEEEEYSENSIAY